MKTLILLLLVISAPAFANELTLMFIKSPNISWESPRELAKSTLEGMTKTYGLGHVNIRIACGEREVLTGIYNRYKDETTRAILKEGQGMGVLFNLFEGLLQEQKFIAPTFEKLAKDERTSFITFKVNPKTCQRLLDYHDQYVELMNSRQKLPRKKKHLVDETQLIFYGFPAISRLGEGGGCSGFGMSFLEVAGIKEEWMTKEWSQEVLVPAEVIGKPLRNDKVSLTSVMFKGPKQWAKPHEPHFVLFFWDPDRMHQSMKEKIVSGEFEVLEKYKTKGIVLDRRMVPTPDEPIFLNEPFSAPSNPREIYHNQEELKKRYDYSKRPSSWFLDQI